MTHCMSWIGLEGEHKFYSKSLEYIKLLAYEKAFYMSGVKVDGIEVTREF